MLINMIDDGIITHSLASQKLFPEMLKYPRENPNSIAEKNQWINQQNENNLEFLIKEILDKNPEEKERFKNGEKKLTGFFIGKIMKASNGTADPKKINQLLNQLKK
jgi:aspartyl-tRNA(Asn)/glutamyl-tRNA(Gln) amidotransferase subunit B